jgi:hypothetical protein
VLLVLVSLLLGLGALAQPARAEDRHAGYYYPPPSVFETYTSKAQILEDSDRRRRIGFTVELTKDFLAKPYPPDFAVFAKGDDAEKLIIVAIKAGLIDTVYRARALLAELTGIARGSPLFEKYGVEDLFNFYDLCRLMGFKQLTISDGEKFAFQVQFE